MEKTFVPKGQIEGEWYLVDAAGETLGRLATRIATVLIGKGKPTYTPGVLMGDHVIVINARQVAFYPTRAEDKNYYLHSLFPGVLKEVKLSR